MSAIDWPMRTIIDPACIPHALRLLLLLVAFDQTLRLSGQETGAPRLRLMLAADANGTGSYWSCGAAGGLRFGKVAIIVGGHYAFNSAATRIYGVERELYGVVYSAGLYQPLIAARPRKRAGSIACPAWGEARVSNAQRRGERRFRLEGMMRMGYQREVWDYRLYPRSAEGVPPSRSYRVTNHGAQAALGLSLRYASLMAEFAWGAALTMPAVHAGHDPFDGGLRTHRRPFPFRLITQPLARIGFSIPIMSTNTRRP